MVKPNCQHFATALWAIAVMLMVLATSDRELIDAAWAVLVGQLALAFTITAVTSYSRRRILDAIRSEDEKVEKFAGAVLGALDDSGQPRPRR